ncbi:MAG TPA: polysaccharide deacetylase family protein [Polyangiaceae bacterium]|nr:polysaccharide deacetylase family protein [Polyangiaceae bacterium]
MSAPGGVGAPGRLAAVSVDLDETPLYAALHGLGARAAFDRRAVYGRALPRLLAWAEARGLPLTLFAVGADLARPDNAAALAPFVRRGDEIGNHSLDHPYALTRLPARALARQVRGASERIGAALGVRAEGFRAPGYAVDERLLAAVADAGLRYDSSAFPCPAYYAAKLAALASTRLGGRRSRAVVDHPRALLAPAEPYRPGARYWAKGAGPLWELPIAVSGPLRLPFIGTALALSPRPLLDRLVRGTDGARFVNLELHGVDFLDERDGLAALAPFQLDLRVPAARKLARFDRAIGLLRASGRRFVRLREAVDAYET